MSGRWEQLLYTSVDHVVDGRSSSGWQIKEHTEGLSEEEASRIVQDLATRLELRTPLPGFPAPEDIAAADRRLVRRPSPAGELLIHTAAAGNDTTGRPNTMTHVLLHRSEDPTRPLLGADAWRAPWWSTPFGADQVREARVAPEAQIGPGDVVTFDSSMALAMDPRAPHVLSALADVLDRNEAARRTGEGAPRLAVLSTESSDEGAQWIGALLRTCAAESARTISWSTFERVRTEGELEALAGGFEIICVPAGDIAGIRSIPASCVVIDPAAAHAPETPWGILVQAMAADPASWISGIVAVQAIEGSEKARRDLRGASLAWAAAVAVLQSRGLLTSPKGADLEEVADQVVSRCRVPGAEIEGDLVEILDLSAQRSGLSPVERDRQLLLQIGERETDPQRTEEIALRYLGAAVQDPAWWDDAVPVPAALRRSLERWSADPSNADQAGTIFASAPASRRPLGDLRSMRKVADAGLRLPVGETERRWGRTATEILEAPESLHVEAAAVIRELPAELRQSLAEKLEDVMGDRAVGSIPIHAPAAPAVQVPRLHAELVSALLEGVDDEELVRLRLEERLLRLEAGAPTPEAALEAVRSIADVLHRGPEGAELQLSEDSFSALSAAAPAEVLLDLDALHGLEQRARLIRRIVVRDAEHPATVAWAEIVLAEGEPESGQTDRRKPIERPLARQVRAVSLRYLEQPEIADKSELRNHLLPILDAARLAPPDSTAGHGASAPVLRDLVHRRALAVRSLMEMGGISPDDGIRSSQNDSAELLHLAQTEPGTLFPAPQSGQGALAAWAREGLARQRVIHACEAVAALLEAHRCILEGIPLPAPPVGAPHEDAYGIHPHPESPPEAQQKSPRFGRLFTSRTNTSNKESHHG